jgi:hypothetical protein
MTHGAAPAVFIIHEVGAVHGAIQGATQRCIQLSDRFCNPFQIEGVHWGSKPREGPKITRLPRKDHMRNRGAEWSYEDIRRLRDLAAGGTPFSRSNNSNRSRCRRLAHGARRNDSSQSIIPVVKAASYLDESKNSESSQPKRYSDHGLFNTHAHHRSPQQRGDRLFMFH